MGGMLVAPDNPPDFDSGLLIQACSPGALCPRFLLLLLYLSLTASALLSCAHRSISYRCSSSIRRCASTEPGRGIFLSKGAQNGVLMLWHKLAMIVIAW